MKKKLMIRTNLYLSTDTRDKLECLASRNHRSQSKEITSLINLEFEKEFPKGSEAAKLIAAKSEVNELKEVKDRLKQAMDDLDERLKRLKKK